MIELRDGTGLSDTPVVIRCEEGDAVASLARCLDLAIDMGNTSLVVDLGDQRGACAAMLRVLLGAGRRLRERGGRLAVAGSDPGLRRVLDVTLLSQTLAVFETREDALVFGKH